MDNVISLLPAILCGLFLFYWQRQQKKRDDKAEQRAADRRKSELLSLNLQMANAKMSYACAMALKHGKMNGELDDAVEDYGNAKKDWVTFMNTQATERLMGE